jgi:hypothetical protein
MMPSGATGCGGLRMRIADRYDVRCIPGTNEQRSGSQAPAGPGETFFPRSRWAYAS